MIISIPKHRKIPRRIKANKTRHATPISRPVFMIFRSLNLNSVIEAHPR